MQIDNLGFFPKDKDKSMLPSLLILSPCYSSSPGPARDSVANFMAQYAELGGKVRIASVWRCSNVAESRTICVEQFAIPSNFDAVLWIDDDNCFSATDAKRIVQSAVEKKSVVGASYCSRDDSGRSVHGKFLDVPIDCVETEWVGFGLTAMPMALLRAVWSKVGYNIFRDDRIITNATSAEERALIRADDAAFCRHVRNMGQKVYVRVDVQIGHIGPHVYRINQ